MKTRFLTAMIAVIFMLGAIIPAAYAEPLADDPPEVIADTPVPVTPADTPDTSTPAPEIPDTVIPDVPDTSALNPFTPGGAGTVMDYADDGVGKVFYTIMTPDKQVFYLVIDQERSAENVYFLNAVTVDDLLALAVPSEGSTSAIPDTPAVTPTPSQTPTPEPSPAPQQGGGNMGTMTLVIIIVVIGGGAGWYFKIYRPKQQRAASAEAEYEPPDVEETPSEWDETDHWDGDDGGGGNEQ